MKAKIDTKECKFDTSKVLKEADKNLKKHIERVSTKWGDFKKEYPKTYDSWLVKKALEEYNQKFKLELKRQIAREIGRIGIQTH